MFLDLMDFCDAETWFIGLIVHFEELDFFKPVLRLPFDRLGLLFWLAGLPF